MTTINVEDVEIRTTNTFGFRPMDWALLCGMDRHYVEFAQTYRWCYVVLFPDGKSDHWPVVGGGPYEFRNKEK